jgi:ABC-type transport system involved in multi-copper enzyme maturation permease subunit
MIFFFCPAILFYSLKASPITALPKGWSECMAFSSPLHDFEEILIPEPASKPASELQL